MYKLTLLAVLLSFVLGCSTKAVKVFVPEKSFKGNYSADSCSHYQNSYMEKLISNVIFYVGITPIDEYDNSVNLRFSFRLNRGTDIQLRDNFIKVKFIDSKVEKDISIDRVQYGGDFVSGKFMGVKLGNYNELFKYENEISLSDLDVSNYYDFNSENMKKIKIPLSERQIELVFPEVIISGAAQKIPNIKLNLKTINTTAIFNCN